MDQSYQILRVPALAVERAADLAQQRVLVRHVFDRDAQRRVLLDEGFVVATEGLDFGVEDIVLFLFADLWWH